VQIWPEVSRKLSASYERTRISNQQLKDLEGLLLKSEIETALAQLPIVEVELEGSKTKPTSRRTQ
jgi:hypothetical protein